MQESDFREYCRHRGFTQTVEDAAVAFVREFEDDLTAEGAGSPETTTITALSHYLQLLVRSGRNSEERLLALARYMAVIRRNDAFIYLALVVEAPGILPALRERTRDLAGATTADAVFASLQLPPAESPLDAYPPVTAEILDRLQQRLPPDTCRRVLTGNMHRIPTEQFNDAAERFRAFPDVDAFLEDRHARLVRELEEHMNQHRLWYEQEITPEVLELVRNNKEIQSGVRDGDTIFVTKIPFSPQAYLHETDPVRKRFDACHCPLARSAILTGSPAISPLLCRCSAGYEKLPFDVVFGEPVEIDVLESVLGGGTRCRFAITIPPGFRKPSASP